MAEKRGLWKKSVVGQRAKKVNQPFVSCVIAGILTETPFCIRQLESEQIIKEMVG